MQAIEFETIVKTASLPYLLIRSNGMKKNTSYFAG